MHGSLRKDTQPHLEPRCLDRNLINNPLRCPLPSACTDPSISSRQCPTCDPCTTSGDFQCVNGGICAASGSCDCPPTFATRDCSADPSDVDGSVCSGHGMGVLSGDPAVPNLQTARCSSCEEGWSTRDCSVNVTDVDQTACSGHGTGVLVGDASEPLRQKASCTACTQGWASSDCSVACCHGHGRCLARLHGCRSIELRVVTPPNALQALPRTVPWAGLVSRTASATTAGLSSPDAPHAPQGRPPRTARWTVARVTVRTSFTPLDGNPRRSIPLP